MATNKNTAKKPNQTKSNKSKAKKKPAPKTAKRFSISNMAMGIFLIILEFFRFMPTSTLMPEWWGTLSARPSAIVLAP